MNIVYSTLGWLDIAVDCFLLLAQIGLKEVLYRLIADCNGCLWFA